MNNALKIILIIFLSLLVLGLSIFLFLFIKNGYSFDFLTAEAKLVESKEFDSVNNLYIESNTADIYLKKSETGKVKVELFSNDVKEKKIENTSNSLNVKLKDGCWLFCFFNRDKIVVYLPENYDKNITIDSSTSDVFFEENYDNSDINIKLSTGDINTKRINNAKVSLSTGDVNIESVNSIESSSSTGDVNINKVNSYMDIETSTGDIYIKEANINKNSNLKASTGDVEVKKLNNVYIDADTSTGDVNVKNNNRKSDVELKVRTSTGDIDINY
ncbi:MAG: DUF4097 family beta strand repeat protein [Bacilli bacterium]|nr:DUF4097 family beta strand repeat protein [Bacilli bacterium]